MWLLVNLVIACSQLLLLTESLQVLTTEEASCKVTTDKGKVDLSSIAKSGTYA